MNKHFIFEYEFGRILREKREEKGIAIKTLAEHIGVSEMALSRYERGERKLTFDVAK
jgi:predicted transcriptional regulator